MSVAYSEWQAPPPRDNDRRDSMGVLDHERSAQGRTSTKQVDQEGKTDWRIMVSIVKPGQATP